MLPKSIERNGRSNDRTAEIRKGVVFVSSDYTPAPYPEDVLNYRHIIIHEELPENISCGSELQVFVRKVNSPSDFWINICGLDYSRKLVTLYTDMRLFYEEKQDRYLFPNYAVLIGQFCVCIYRNEWHRARIVNAADKELVDVFFIDCGGTVTVSTSNLRYMHKKFSHLPMQSFHANLPAIKPRSSAEWPNTVCEFFRQETSGKKFTAKVVNMTREKHSVSLKLLGVNRNSVSEKLLSNNMAVSETLSLDTSTRMMRNEGSIVSSIDASFLKVDNITRMPHNTSSRIEDNSKLPEEEPVSRSEDAPVSWTTVAEKKLLLITIMEKRYFVLSDFLQAFSVLHQHVVLKLLETFPSSVVVQKMDDKQLIDLLFSAVKGCRIRGLAHLSDRRILPSVYLLPVEAACQLFTFLEEDDS